MLTVNLFSKIHNFMENRLVLFIYICINNWGHLLFLLHCFTNVKENFKLISKDHLASNIFFNCSNNYFLGLSWNTFIFLIHTNNTLFYQKKYHTHDRYWTEKYSLMENSWKFMGYSHNIFQSINSRET